MNKNHFNIIKKLFAVLLVILLFLILSITLVSYFLYEKIPNDFKTLLPQVPRLIGISPSAEKNYLILLQNNNELRPTGGFISAIALVKFKSGKLSWEIRDVYSYLNNDLNNTNLNDSLLPQSLQNYFKQITPDYHFTFRDGNISPDFPQTVDLLNKLQSSINLNQQFDGIFAININTISTILQTIGPLEIDNLKITPDNFFETISADTHNIDRHSLEDLKNRKDIFPKLLEQILNKLKNEPLIILNLLPTIDQQLQNHDIQLWSTDPILKQFIADNNWDGKLQSTSNSNFISLNESNFSALKNSRYLKKDLDIKTYLSGKDPHSLIPITQIKLTTTNLGSNNLPFNGPYRGQFNFYIPLNSKILNTPDNLSITNLPALKLKQISFNLNLKPTESTSLEFSYSEPTINSNYQLKIQRQSGDQNTFLNYSITTDDSLRLNNNSGFTTENFDLYSSRLLQDTNFNFQITPKNIPPFIYYQEFIDLNSLKIIFSDPMNEQDLTNINNFKLTDTDKNNSQHDQLSIEKIEPVNNKEINIFINGLSNQPEEFYQLTLTNLYNLSGQELSPNPKIIHLVQRLTK